MEIYTWKDAGLRFALAGLATSRSLYVYCGPGASTDGMVELALSTNMVEERSNDFISEIYVF